MRSIWDDLYDLYCFIEEKHLSRLTYKYENEYIDETIRFPERECDLIELKKIRDFLGSQCEDYFRF
jgi:hypothetical protein